MMRTFRRRILKSGNDLLEALLRHIAIRFSPEKAFALLEYMCENFPCREHTIENCQECTSKISEIYKNMRSELDNNFEKLIKELKGHTDEE